MAKGDEKIIKTTPCPECEGAAFGRPVGVDIDVHTPGYNHANMLGGGKGK